MSLVEVHINTQLSPGIQTSKMKEHQISPIAVPSQRHHVKHANNT
jgi:hypothetical protein